MVRATRAKSVRKRPAYLLGVAAAHLAPDDHHHARPRRHGRGRVRPRAFAQAGVKPSDIDVVELYDAFTINTILFLEDLGFCRKGEGDQPS